MNSLSTIHPPRKLTKWLLLAMYAVSIAVLLNAVLITYLWVDPKRDIIPLVKVVSDAVSVVGGGLVFLLVPSVGAFVSFTVSRLIDQGTIERRFYTNSDVKWLFRSAVWPWLKPFVPVVISIILAMMIAAIYPVADVFSRLVVCFGADPFPEAYIRDAINFLSVVMLMILSVMTLGCILSIRIGVWVSLYDSKTWLATAIAFVLCLLAYWAGLITFSLVAQMIIA